MRVSKGGLPKHPLSLLLPLFISEWVSSICQRHFVWEGKMRDWAPAFNSAAYVKQCKNVLHQRLINEKNDNEWLGGWFFRGRRSLRCVAGRPLFQYILAFSLCKQMKIELRVISQNNCLPLQEYPAVSDMACNFKNTVPFQKRALFQLLHEQIRIYAGIFISQPFSYMFRIRDPHSLRRILLPRQCCT